MMDEIKKMRERRNSAFSIDSSNKNELDEKCTFETKTKDNIKTCCLLSYIKRYL